MCVFPYPESASGRILETRRWAEAIVRIIANFFTYILSFCYGTIEGFSGETAFQLCDLYVFLGGNNTLPGS